MNYQYPIYNLFSNKNLSDTDGTTAGVSEYFRGTGVPLKVLLANPYGAVVRMEIQEAPEHVNSPAGDAWTPLGESACAEDICIRTRNGFLYRFTLVTPAVPVAPVTVAPVAVYISTITDDAYETYERHVHDHHNGGFKCGADGELLAGAAPAGTIFSGPSLVVDTSVSPVVYPSAPTAPFDKQEVVDENGNSIGFVDATGFHSDDDSDCGCQGSVITVDTTAVPIVYPTAPTSPFDTQGVIDSNGYSIGFVDATGFHPIDTRCKQYIDLQLDPCPLVFPICASGLEFTDAAGIQSYLDTTYGAGNLKFDDANCTIKGCVLASVDFSFVLESPNKVITLSAATGALTINEITTSDGSPVSVVWPDGSTESGNATSTAASQPAGNAVITLAGCACGSELKVTGPFDFVMDDLNQFGCLTEFFGSTGNTTSGDLANLPAGLTYYNNQGLNTTYGDIDDLPSTLTTYNNKGTNTTSGDLANLPAGLTFYLNQGLNTSYGDIADLPAGLTIYSNTGSNTTTGDLANLPAGLLTYYNFGSNTTYGDIDDLPSTLTTYYNVGTNTTSGDLANLPAGLTYYNNQGLNTTYGDIDDLPSTLTTYSNKGNNVTSGDLANLPAGLTYYNNAGANTSYGDIANLPAGVTYYSNTGTNTTSGDIADLPAGLTYYLNTGANTVTSASIPVFNSSFIYFYHHSFATSAEVDNVLAGLAQVTTWFGAKYVNLQGSNPAPSAAGLASAATITAAGVTVLTN